MYGDEYDDDQDATMSEDEDIEDQDDADDEGDEDAYASASPPDDDDLLAEVIDLLGSKMGVHIPDHVSLDTFLRDLCMALHGHPGYDFPDEDQGDTDEASSAQMSAGRRRRKRKRKQLSQARRQATSRGVSAQRGKAAAAEQLKNAGMAK